MPKEKLTEESSPVFLLDKTVKYLPEAVVLINTPYLTGTVFAKCMDNPLYDLVLGNMNGVRGVDQPILEWTLLKKTGIPMEVPAKKPIAELMPHVESQKQDARIDTLETQSKTFLDDDDIVTAIE